MSFVPLKQGSILIISTISRENKELKHCSLPSVVRKVFSRGRLLRSSVLFNCLSQVVLRQNIAGSQSCSFKVE